MASKPAAAVPSKENAPKPAAKAPTKASTKPDLATLGGLVLAIGGIMAGLLMEGGKIKDVSQVTAAMIVLGGTIGAVMVTTPLDVLLRAAKQLKAVFLDKSQPTEACIEAIIAYASQARKEGIVSLEKQAGTVTDPFLRKALNLAVDGIEMQQIRSIMELEIALLEERGESEAKVFEAAGGYAPTVGIIGAVLGLIQVMKNLANIDEVGRGIAVAFVATVYGVASANLFFLPAAAKLRSRLRNVVRERELMLDGVLAITEGLNPKLIRTKLEAYQPPAPPAAEKPATSNKAAAAQAAVPAEG